MYIYVYIIYIFIYLDIYLFGATHLQALFREECAEVKKLRDELSRAEEAIGMLVAPRLFRCASARKQNARAPTLRPRVV